jgi:hypothetical protein
MPGVRRRTTFSNRRSGSRRKLVWATQATGVVPLAVGANVATDLLFALHVAGASTLGATVMRTHVSLFVDDWTTDTDRVDFGLIIGRRSDPVAGLPLATEDELDWMLLRRLKPQFSGAVPDIGYTTDVDLRAKRKVQELDQTLLLVVGGASGIAAAMTFEIFSRTLLALP